MKTKAEVDAELDRLEKRIPELIAECEPDWLLEAFASESECLRESAPSEHAEYVRGRLDCMLASVGLIPGETEGEPCGSLDP
jgi:hypothetical protein